MVVGDGENSPRLYYPALVLILDLFRSWIRESRLVGPAVHGSKALLRHSAMSALSLDSLVLGGLILRSQR